VQSRDRKPGDATGAVGRPAFGIGPIGRVSTTMHALPGAPAPAEASLPERPSPTQVALAAAPKSGFRTGWPDAGRARAGDGSPNLRRNVCPHFYLTGLRGALPVQAPHLLKGLARRDGAVSRCQVRGGVHLEHGYMNDVCLSPRFNQCVFYEEALTRERTKG